MHGENESDVTYHNTRYHFRPGNRPVTALPLEYRAVPGLKW